MSVAQWGILKGRLDVVGKGGRAMKHAGRTALAATGIWLAGCGPEPGLLAGGNAVWRPGVAVPVLPVPAQAHGRAWLVGGMRQVQAGALTLDNRGRIVRTVDDSLRPGFDAAVRVSDGAGIRLSMEGWNYGAEGYGAFAGDWYEGALHLGIRAMRLSTVRRDSVYPGLLDLFGTKHVDTTEDEPMVFAPTGGATVALFPRAPVRPWLAWATTRLPDPGLESSVQPVVAAGGWLHELSAGAILGEATGFQAWGGAGLSMTVASGVRMGWNAAGGVGLGF